MDDALRKFEHLWTTHAGRYVLVRDKQDRDRYLIVEQSTRMALVIEDDALSTLVKERMKAAGVPVVDRL